MDNPAIDAARLAWNGRYEHDDEFYKSIEVGGIAQLAVDSAREAIAQLHDEVERLRARIQGMRGGDAVAGIQGSCEAWITAERDEARASIERVRAVHERSHVEDDWYICDACSRMTTDPIGYPCETIRALDDE